MTETLVGQFPKHIGSTGGLLNSAETEEKYAIVWKSSKEQAFELPTGGAAIMHEGDNLMYFARKEQCLALGTQLRALNCVPRARHCSFLAKYIKLSPSCIIAAPPVGNSNACSFELFQTIAYFSSVSAEFNNPPVLPICFGNWPTKVSVILDFLLFIIRN